MLPTTVACEPGEVQLRWSCVRDFTQNDISRFFRMLTPEEQAHARSAKTEIERVTRVVARGVLREELASRTGCSPLMVPLENTFAGKPVLSQRVGGNIKFNLSHSDGWILYAFARGFDLGVDIEHINPANVNWDLVGRKDKEDLACAQLPERRCVDDFFRQWVSQEAVLKGAGCGLIELETVLEALDASWQVIELEAPPGFVAALAIPRASLVLSYR